MWTVIVRDENDKLVERREYPSRHTAAASLRGYGKCFVRRDRQASVYAVKVYRK